MRDLVSQLKDLKTNSKAGFVSGVQRDKMRANLLEAIGHEEKVLEPVAVGATHYTRWVFVDFISKPLAASVAIFVMLMGGWMTTVSAASESLPGDTLYNVKLVTERAKLKLASSEERAILHTEFAERRLNEAMELGDNAQATVAFDAFKKEIELAGTELRNLKDAGSVETVAVATKIDKKINELSAVLNDNSKETGVVDAQAVAEATSNGVVDVMVESHEEAGTESSSENLGKVFRTDVQKITDRQTYDLGRVAVIKGAIGTNDLAKRSGVSSEQVVIMEFSVVHSTDRLPEAMNSLAVGGYRDALNILRNIEQALAHVETQIAEAEIAITTAPQTLEEINSLTNNSLEEI